MKTVFQAAVIFTLFLLQEKVCLASAQYYASPVAVTCGSGRENNYALCAYANCTINADLKTASCPCFRLSGPSVARIDVIPDENLQRGTIEMCTKKNSTLCDGKNATAIRPNETDNICNAIVQKTLWPKAEAISTFSMGLQVENGVDLDENGNRGNDATWSCSAVEERMVPNCMLAPCRILETPETNPYYAGEATMDCTCPLMKANVDYVSFGGLQSPCYDSPIPKAGGYVQNTGGAVLAKHASDPAAVAAAWKAVSKEFNGIDGNNDIYSGSGINSQTSDNEDAKNNLGTSSGRHTISMVKSGMVLTFVIVVMTVGVFY